jgi:NAD(P)-dependent dehydrogenase (short-subunit alcohol dehydrogenase family)
MTQLGNELGQTACVGLVGRPNMTECTVQRAANWQVSRHLEVRSLSPGAIETDFGGGAVRDNAQLNSFIASQTALGRVGMPDDIGGLIASLLSSDNRWVNAQRIEASGGMFL